MSDPTRASVASDGEPGGRRAAKIGGRIVFCLAVALALAAVVFVWVLPGPPGGPSADASRSLVTVTIAGHDAVLVAYEDSGGAVMNNYVGAFDLRTGRRLWHTEIDDVARESRFVAVGRRYVYVTGDFGLFALDVQTGALVGGGQLPFTQVHALTEFVYLPEQNAIAAGSSLANVGGDDPVEVVAVDSVRVKAAGAATSAAFVCALDSVCRGGRPDPTDPDSGPVTSAAGRTVRVVERRYDHLPPISWLLGDEYRISDELHVTEPDGSERTIVLGAHGWFSRLR